MSIVARRWLINLGLLALLGALLLVVRLDQRETLRETRLTPLQPEAVTRIVLERAGEPAVRLQRRDTRWEMTEPFAVPAVTDSVAALLPLARASVSRTLPAAGLDLAELGLERPPVRLRLDGLELRFGATEPIAERRYVQQGDTVHLIDDRYLPRLLTPTVELISPRLLPPDFSPGLGDLDGTPLTAGSVAPLADAVAVRVEQAADPQDEVLLRHMLSLDSADGGDGLLFAVGEGGTRWTRLDTGLSWLFATPPLALFGPEQRAASTPSAVTPAQAPAARAMPSAPATTLPAPEPALPVQRLAPPLPGSAPTEPKATAAIPELRAMAPSRPPNPNALPQTGADPFAPPADADVTPEETSAPPMEPSTPLRTERLRP